MVVVGELQLEDFPRHPISFLFQHLMDGLTATLRAAGRRHLEQRQVSFSQDEDEGVSRTTACRSVLDRTAPPAGARACAARQSSQRGMDILERSWRTYPKLTVVKATMAQVCQDPLA
jgi:hypothetical protein